MAKRFILGIIQARMGSDRFPGKSLAKINGKPLVLHCIERLKQIQLLDHLVLATSDLDRDDPLEAVATQAGIEVFRGSETDVLGRFYQAAKCHAPSAVARFTGDCPLIDPVISNRVIERHLKEGNDYTSNTVVRSYPRGLDTEVMTFDALQTAWRKAIKEYEREHVTPYLYEHKEIFKIGEVIAERRYFAPDIRLTVDTREDLQFIECLFDELYDPDRWFRIDEIMDLLRRKPELKQISEHVKQRPLTSNG